MKTIYILKASIIERVHEKTGRNQAGIIMLKSPIWPKLGPNAKYYKLTNVCK